MKNILTFLTFSILLVSPFAHAAQLRVEIGYELTGWSRKTVRALSNEFKRLNEASVTLSVEDAANNNASPLEAFACKVQVADINTSANDVLVAADLVCEGPKANALKAFDYKRFVEITLSQEAGYPIRVNPRRIPGSATVHN